MSRIDKLSIRGIRSFDPSQEVKIEFFTPLTLIQGQNGSGKTTIIECLKMATSGSLPPLSTNGKTFICDPKITNTTEVKSSIKLKFQTPRDKEVIIVRNFLLTYKNSKYEFKRLEQLLKSTNSKNELVTINSTCIDIDKQVPLLMHASRAILENVIFCHQEDTNWPFSEASVLKKVFDEIFDTTKYTKSLEDLKDTIKEFTSKSKDLKVKIELLTKDYDQFRKLTIQKEQTQNKMVELNLLIQDYSSQIEKSEADLEKIKQLEENRRRKEIELLHLKNRLEEIGRQINIIKSEPYFVDYTENDEVFNNFINKNKINTESLDSSICMLRSKIFDYKQKDEVLHNEVSHINATIKSNEDMQTKYEKNKLDIIYGLNQCDPSFNLPHDSSLDINVVVGKINNKIEEIKEKMNLNEEKKVYFDSKLNEKLKDMHLKNGFLEKVISEIKTLKEKEEQYLTLAKSNDNTVNNTLNSLTNEINQLNSQINNISAVLMPEIDKQMEKEKSEVTNHQLLTNQFNASYHNILNKRDYFYTLKPIYISLIEKKKSFDAFLERCNFKKISYSNDSLTYVKNEKEEISGNKNKVVNEIEIQKSKLNSVEKIIFEKSLLLSEKIKRKEEVSDHIYSIFKKLNIKDLNFEKLNTMNEDILNKIENLNFEVVKFNGEIDILREMYIASNNNKNCSFCNQNLTLKNLSKINQEVTDKTAKLSRQIEESKETLQVNNLLLNEIKKSQPEIIKLNEIKTSIEEIEKELEKYETERTSLLNEKMLNEQKLFKISEQLSSIDNEILFITEYLSLSTDLEEKTQQFNKILNDLNLSFLNSNHFESQFNELQSMLAKYDNSLQQINSLNDKLLHLQNMKSKYYEQLNSLNHEVRQIEKQKSNYIQNVQNLPDIMKRIEDVREEISKRLEEKTSLELENININEKYTLLLEKQRELISVLNQSTNKSKDKLSLMNDLKIKLQIVESELQELNQNQNSHEVTKKVLEEKISERVGLKTEIEQMEKDLRQFEEKKKNSLISEAIYKNNKLLYSLKQEKSNVTFEIMNKETHFENKEKLLETKELIIMKITQQRNQMNINKGKVLELDSSLIKISTELKHNTYNEIESRLNKLKTELIVTQEIIKNAQDYYEAVDHSLLKYHAKRMEEINKLINYYWSMTYKGTDIKWIEIRSDMEKTIKSRSYNYRIVFGTSRDSELDMRGRCSAGQKMLASIIIRLALAETFCNSCGILCLDEPTTNLDEQHIKSLAKSLRDLIQARAENSNFQLVVITHDPTFIDLIGSDFSDSYYHVYKNQNKFSSIEVKSISSTFK